MSSTIVAFVRRRLAHIPQGSAALFFIQIFSTLGFAVLYSSLVLYATEHLNFPQVRATAVMGVFGAFNYGLHLFGGYLGGRFLSNRNLFVGGMALQVIGCGCIATGTVPMLYVGLAFFLTGSGLNVTCINMMLTQRFAPDDDRREAAFLWNYAGMNVGFFIGFAAAGYFQDAKDYRSMFLFATVGNFLAIVLALINWKRIGDLHTRLIEAPRSQFIPRLALGLFILLGLVPTVWWLLQQAWVGALVKGIGACVLLYLIQLTARHPDARERNNMTAYLILAMGSLVFWTLYQMAPSGLQLFADHNVDLHLGGVKIAPQWVQNINTVVIVVGGPILAALFAQLRERGWRIDVPQQFSAALLLMGAGFLLLPVGIGMAGADGRSAFSWLFWSYILQSIGELLISPVGYAMIGRLAPRQHQGVMMGAWMLVTGIASLFSGDFSGMLPEAKGTTAAATNPEYASLFSQLGWGTVAVGVVLVVLIPFLRRLIRDAEKPEDEAPVGVVPTLEGGTHGT
jgi:POT family proton-dependent oligopeptide transporter